MNNIISTFLNGAELISEKLFDWAKDLVLMIPNLLLSILVLILFAILAKYIKKLIKRSIHKMVESQALVGLTATIGQFAVVMAGFLITLNLLNLEKTVTSILAGAGVIGLALGFAFQETAANFISGIFIAARNPIKIGDVVSVSGGEMGVVDRINLRSTVLKTFQGQDLIIPNKEVYQNQLKNYSTGTRRIDLACGISYGEDLEKVKKLALQAIKKLNIALATEPIEFHYNEFGDSSINFNLKFWIEYPSHIEFLDARSEAIISLKKTFDENDITIPFPIRTLDFGIKGGKTLSSEMKTLSLKTE